MCFFRKKKNMIMLWFFHGSSTAVFAGTVVSQGFHVANLTKSSGFITLFWW